MSIIFYEYEYSKKIIEEGVKKVTQRDLNFIAKYYDYEGLSNPKILNNVIDFCMNNDPNFNVIQRRTLLKRVMTHCSENKIRFPQPIGITKKELDTIQSLEDYTKEKFLFSILVTAKFFKYHSSKKRVDPNRKEVDLYINQPIKDIIELSGTSISLNKWKQIKHEFCVAALLSPTRVSSSRFALGFEDKNSEPFMIIDDYRNIISYYQNYCGERMINCESCGTLISKRTNRHKLCRKCWAEKQKIWSRNGMRKIRN